MKQTMLKKEVLLGAVALGALALNAAPAGAQERAGSQELSVYGGELFGDDLTDRAVSGRKPKLDDDLTYGLRYGYNFTDTWGAELSLGHTTGSATDLPGRDADLDLTTFDVDAVWHFNPGERLVPYAFAGVGIAWADLDRVITGTVDGRPVTINDDNGFTLNAGAGLKYFATDNLSLRLDARYRYMNSVVDRFDDPLNTVETTLGVGWKF